MIPVDHRFAPIPHDPTRCAKCREPRDHAGHFGDHAKQITPVPGFACSGVLNVIKTKERR